MLVRSENAAFSLLPIRTISKGTEFGASCGVLKEPLERTDLV